MSRTDPPHHERLYGTDAWVTFLSQVELPVLANTLRRINELTDSTSSTVNELASVILNDAQLTSQVLRLSNTVFYNQTRTQVSTVSRAITLIGFDAVKGMAISSLIVDTLLARSDRSHLLQCLARAIHAAVQARCLLPSHNVQALEEVFIGALLMNIGELAFWSCDTEQAGELEFQLHRGEPPVTAQKEILQSTFVAITRGLAEAWALGPFIRDVVSAGSAHSKEASLVRHCVEMARLSEKGWRGADMDQVVDALARDTGAPAADVRHQVRANSGEASRIAVSLGIPQVAELLPGGDAAQGTLSVPKMDPALQLSLLRELASMLTGPRPDLNEVCQKVTEGLQTAVGLRRVVMLMADASGRRLIPRKLMGQGTETWRDHFLMNLDGSGDLGALLPGPGTRVFQPQKHGEPLAFDPWLSRVPALVSPLVANNRLVGMFYADNADPHWQPDDDQVTAFSHFSQHAQLCISLLAAH